MSRCMKSNNPQMTKGLFCQIPFSFSKNNPLSWDPQIKICRTKSHLDITLWYVFSSQHRLCFRYFFCKIKLELPLQMATQLFFGGEPKQIYRWLLAMHIIWHNSSCGASPRSRRALFLTSGGWRITGTDSLWFENLELMYVFFSWVCVFIVWF